jgi:hypothetical protein
LEVIEGLWDLLGVSDGISVKDGSDDLDGLLLGKDVVEGI